MGCSYSLKHTEQSNNLGQVQNKKLEEHNNAAQKKLGKEWK